MMMEDELKIEIDGYVTCIVSSKFATYHYIKQLQKENEELKAKNYSYHDTYDQQKQIIGQLESDLDQYFVRYGAL